jgi:hypothetical protein
VLTPWKVLAPDLARMLRIAPVLGAVLIGDDLEFAHRFQIAEGIARPGDGASLLSCPSSRKLFERAAVAVG